MAEATSRTVTVGAHQYPQPQTDYDKRLMEGLIAKLKSNGKWKVIKARFTGNDWLLLTPRGIIGARGTFDEMRQLAFDLTRER